MTHDRNTLRGIRVLVMEDDYYLATDLQDVLEGAGASVVGPCSTPSEAERLTQSEVPDCALLDLNLGNGPSYELPRALIQRRVPFAFVTGYDRQSIPEEFASAERLEKPVEPRQVVAVAARLSSAS